MGHCCNLGAAVEEKRVLFKSDNFFVVPTVGPIEKIRGYLLMVPLNHFLGYGMMPEHLWSEAEEVLRDTKQVLKSTYGVPVTVFEHGPRLRMESGGCVDHAHFHLIPGIELSEIWASDMVSRLGSLGQYCRVDRTEGFRRMQQLSNSEGSYLFLETLDNRRLVSEQNFDRPRQYYRRMAAVQVDSTHWNWRRYPGRELMMRTFDDLSGKF